MRGSRELDVGRARRSNSGTAAAIIGEWKAPVTSSSIAPQAELLGVPRPRPGCSSVAPDSTICMRRVVVGDGQRRGRRRSPAAWSAAPAPITATIDAVAGRARPTRASAGRAARPSSSPSRSSSAPAATSAPSSPSEWPAMQSPSRASRAPSSRRGSRRRSPAGRSWCPRRPAGTGPRRPSSTASSSRSGRALARPARASRASGSPGRGTGSRSCRAHRDSSNRTPDRLGVRYRRGSRTSPRSGGTSPIRRYGDFPPFRRTRLDAGTLRATPEPPRADATDRRARHRRLGRDRRRRSPASWRGAATRSCSSRGARTGSTSSPPS